MPYYPSPIEKLIESFTRLPGIGRKTAERFVFYLLKQPKQELQNFSQNIFNLQANTSLCPDCFNFSEGNGLCSICRDPKRNKNQICVVEKIHDLNMLESTREFNGLYHILGGKLDPIEGIVPEKLKIRQLEERIEKNNIEEIILAINPDIQGEGTILYLRKTLQPFNLKVTLLARGLPMGSDIEYADEATLSRALKGRTEL
ncbi:recombination mediator RecR [Patescibacteria group bacterium]|nr:recombination mediator RecR [Patescibacteria group bacterium]